MDTTNVVILVAVLLVLGAALWMFAMRMRSRELHRRFGGEYDRLAEETGNRRQTEAELQRRAKRMKQFTIRPLPADLRSRFTQMWSMQEARFVEEPNAAVAEADLLVEKVMRERGYPVGEFDQRADDVSVDHPAVVQNYRAAHEIAMRQERGQASTEDLRRAMLYYRDLFRELLDDSVTPIQARTAS